MGEDDSNPKKDIKRCTKCLLPESYPGIEFNEERVCNYCLTYKKTTNIGEETFYRIIKSIQNKGEEYDCLLGISGGRDSSYALHYLVKVCNLRVLAYTADHGFVPEAAKTNMKKMVDLLDVELIVEEHDSLKTCIKNNVSSWMRKPSPPMIHMICCGCRLGIFRGLLKCAKRNKIPLVVIGSGNVIERCDFKYGFFSKNPLGRIQVIRKSKLLSLLFGLLYELIKNPFYLLNPKTSIAYVKEYFYFFYREKVTKILYPNQNLIHLFHYLDWDEHTILSTIKNELNWMQAADSASSWRFDCSVSFLKNYLLNECVGFTEKDVMLSNMIREKMITREEAHKRLKNENIIPKRLISELFNEIGLEFSQLNSALEKVENKHI